MKRLGRHAAAGLAAILCLAASHAALAADEQNVTPGYAATGAPLALRGYDPVAFFTASAPTPGKAELAAVHDGATYYFASRANRDAFEANPAAYVPAYGGFCAFGVSVGKKFDGDPHYWTVSAGRLYLNLNADISRKFQEDVAGSISKADRQWSKIEHKAAADL